MSSEMYPNLGFDPAPGDLDSVRDLARAIGRVTQGGDTAQTELRKMGTSDGVWAGKSANAFKETFSEVPPYLKKSLGSLSTAHRALTSWEKQLDGFQARARKLEEEAAEAVRRVNSAQVAMDGLPSSTSGMSDKEKEQHEKDSKSKKNSLDSANSELSAIRSRARSLHTEHESAATDISRLVKGAADDAPPEPSWFEDALNAASDLLGDAWDTITDPNFWKMIGDILADIAMVVGVLALFFSGLGVAAFIIAGLALAFHLAAKAGGADVTWETIAWDAVGVFAAWSQPGGWASRSIRPRPRRGRARTPPFLRLHEGIGERQVRQHPGRAEGTAQRCRQLRTRFGHRRKGMVVRRLGRCDRQGRHLGGRFLGHWLQYAQRNLGSGPLDRWRVQDR